MDTNTAITQITRDAIAAIQKTAMDAIARLDRATLDYASRGRAVALGPTALGSTALSPLDPVAFEEVVSRATTAMHAPQANEYTTVAPDISPEDAVEIVTEEVANEAPVEEKPRRGRPAKKAEAPAPTPEPKAAADEDFFVNNDEGETSETASDASNEDDLEPDLDKKVWPGYSATKFDTLKDEAIRNYLRSAASYLMGTCKVPLTEIASMIGGVSKNEAKTITALNRDQCVALWASYGEVLRNHWNKA